MASCDEVFASSWPSEHSEAVPWSGTKMNEEAGDVTVEVSLRFPVTINGGTLW